jgi:diadenosine tetraphosphatase ApaH/serine/threonine PP2A family protein phosphatase
MGNHDVVAAGLEEPNDFNPIARKAILWTRSALDAGNISFLRELPESRTLAEGVKLVHGSLLHRDHYLLSQFDLQENFYRMRTSTPAIRLLFFGHTHYQVAFVARDSEIYSMTGKRFQLEDSACCVVNPGSVGQPRDHDPRASFVIYDNEEGSIELLRTSYNLTACTQKILSAGLPRELAERLYQGW